MDLAKIGIAVEASGVPEAQNQLRALGETGKLAGNMLVVFSDSADKAGTGVEKTGQSAHRAASGLHVLRGSIGAVAQELGALGPQVSGIETLIVGLLTKMTPMGIALTTIGIIVGTGISLWQDYKEKLKDVAEEEARLDSVFVKRKLSAAQIGAEITKEIRLYQALDPALQTINERYDEQSRKLKDLGASTQKLNDVAAAREAAQLKLFKDRTTSGVTDLASIGFQIQKLGLLGQALSDVTLAEKLFQIRNSELAKTMPGLATALELVTTAASHQDDVFRRLTTGQKAIGDFEAKFGVQFDFNKDLAQRSLAAGFASVFLALKDDPTARGALNEAFGSLIGQLSDLGTQNIGGLLRNLGLSRDDLALLTQGLQPIVTGMQEVERESVSFEQNVFGGTTKITDAVTILVPLQRNLRDLYEQSNVSTKNWGEAAAAAADKNAKASTAAGAAQEAFNQSVQVGKDRIIAMAAAIDAIPPVTERTLRIRVETVGDTTFLSNLPGGSAVIERSDLPTLSPDIAAIEQTVRRTTGTRLNTRIF
jgi:hypothetical protein